jgi:hypothetical protein
VATRPITSCTSLRRPVSETAPLKAALLKATFLKAAAGLLVLAGTTSACIPEPAPGEFGTFRYVANVRGTTPLALVPPISDREGNAYVLYDVPTQLTASQLYIGHYEGGWSSNNCFVDPGTSTFGNTGVHGFVGRAEQRAWFWVGPALVKGNGRLGFCSRILENDPSSGAKLEFRAVVPWVRETPSRLTTIAWIQAALDPRPFRVVIDLKNNVYTSLDEFGPSDATDVTILGVGGNLSEGEGVLLARYTVGGNTVVQARFVDHEGGEIDSASVSGLGNLPEYGIVGYLQASDTGLYAGLDNAGGLVVLDHSGGTRRDVNGMTPVGVHKWDGQLYLVGEANGRPKLAKLDDDGDVGKIGDWDASIDALGELKGTTEVIDDRSLPSTQTKWRDARTAMGSFPFLHPHSVDRYASATTTWLVAGPVLNDEITAIAFVPVGISYDD